MHLDWVSLIILILNAAVSVLTNMDVNRKRDLTRKDD